MTDQKEQIGPPRGTLLIRNSAINFIGQVLPMAVALFSIPVLIRGLTTERFGILTLVWSVIGYFSLFDLGLGRALTQLIAEKLGKGEQGSVPPYVWTATLMLTALGVVGGVVLWFSADWLVFSILKIPAELQAETVTSIHLLAFNTPLILIIAALAGVLSAYQRFGVLNAIRVPSGVFSFVGPLLVLPFSHSLFWVTAVLTLGRIATGIAHFLVCLHVVPSLRSNLRIDKSAVMPLIRFGGWMTVSNVISPIMTQLDRFVIGGLVSVAAVAYYTTPYEAVGKLWILPVALAGVIFPAFAASQDRERSLQLFVQGTKYTGLILFPIVLIICTFAREGLYIWLGSEFSSNSTSVAQVLTIGVFLNSLAMVFFAYVQGIGRPDLTAKLHCLECPIYIAVLWLAIRQFGILGAAFAWSFRMALDAYVLLLMSRHFLKKDRAFRQMAEIMTAAVVVLCVPMFIGPVALRSAIAVAALAAYSVLTWRKLLDRTEKDRILALAAKARRYFAGLAADVTG